MPTQLNRAQLQEFVVQTESALFECISLIKQNPDTEQTRKILMLLEQGCTALRVGFMRALSRSRNLISRNESDQVTLHMVNKGMFQDYRLMRLGESFPHCLELNAYHQTPKVRNNLIDIVLTNVECLQYAGMELLYTKEEKMLSLQMVQATDLLNKTKIQGPLVFLAEVQRSTAATFVTQAFVGVMEEEKRAAVVPVAAVPPVPQKVVPFLELNILVKPDFPLEFLHYSQSAPEQLPNLNGKASINLVVASKSVLVHCWTEASFDKNSKPDALMMPCFNQDQKERVSVAWMNPATAKHVAVLGSSRPFPVTLSSRTAKQYGIPEVYRSGSYYAADHAKQCQYEFITVESFEQSLSSFCKKIILEKIVSNHSYYVVTTVAQVQQCIELLSADPSLNKLKELFQEGGKILDCSYNWVASFRYFMELQNKLGGLMQDKDAFHRYRVNKIEEEFRFLKLDQLSHYFKIANQIKDKGIISLLLNNLLLCCSSHLGLLSEEEVFALGDQIARIGELLQTIGSKNQAAFIAEAHLFSALIASLEEGHAPVQPSTPQIPRAAASAPALEQKGAREVCAHYLGSVPFLRAFFAHPQPVPVAVPVPVPPRHRPPQVPFNVSAWMQTQIAQMSKGVGSRRQTVAKHAKQFGYYALDAAPGAKNLTLFEVVANQAKNLLGYDALQIQALLKEHLQVYFNQYTTAAEAEELLTADAKKLGWDQGSLLLALARALHLNLVIIKTDLFVPVIFKASDALGCIVFAHDGNQFMDLQPLPIDPLNARKNLHLRVDCAPIIDRAHAGFRIGC